MRFFIALEIPQKNRDQISQVQRDLIKIIPQARISENAKLHLTIAFVGEQKEYLKDRLVEVIKKAAEALPPFEVTPAYIDGFPNIHNPHVLWVGVKGDVDKLLILRERIKDGLVELKLQVDERRFIPHIAIAKALNLKISNKQEVELEKIMAFHFDPIEVTQVKLFESVPDEGFHTHNTLSEVELTG